jgi:hypothetical protein
LRKRITEGAPAGIGCVRARQCAVVARLGAGRHRRFAQRFQAFLRAVAAIGLAGLDQAVRHLAVTRHAQGLVVRTFVVVQPQPLHAFEDRIHRFLGGALAIGILDAQDEFAAAAPGLQPAIQRRARTADVQVASGAGGETGAAGHGRGSTENGARILPVPAPPYPPIPP